MFNLFVLCLGFLLGQNLSLASDSLSYSGRLVNADGSPVSGPVSLLLELAYSNDTSTIICSKSISDVPLSNGVFHLKLDYAPGDCGGENIAQILASVPAGESAALRVTDQTHSKPYSFQAIHALPYATVANVSKTLVQMGATSGQLLSWDGSKWAPASPNGDGTVTSIATGAGLTGGPISVSGTISVAAGGIVASMLNQMGAATGNVLKWNGSGWTPSPDSGLTVESDPTVQGFAKNSVPTCLGTETLRFDALLNAGAGGLFCEAITLTTDDVSEGSNQYFTDARAKAAAVADTIADGVSDVAPSQNVVFDGLAQKQNTITTATTLGVKELGIGTATPGAALDVRTNLTASSGTEYGIKILPSVTQTGTAGYTGLLMEVTDSGSTGSGARKFLDFRINGVSKFSIDNTGAVTSTVGATGTSATYTSSSGNQLTLGFDGTNKTTINVASDGKTTFTAGGTSPAFNFAGGNVGIGVSSTTEALEVNGNVKASGSFIASELQSPVDLNLTADSDANGSGGLIFKTGTTERARIDNNGYFGLGTTDLSTGVTGHKAQIKIARPDSTLGLLIENSGTSPQADMLLRSTGGPANGKMVQILHDNTGTFQIRGINDDGSTVGKTLFSADVNDGNVGIGTTTPSDKLQVMGNGTFTSGSGNITLTPDYSGKGVIQSYQGLGVFRPLQIDGLGVTINGKGSPIALMDGNVGINSSSPGKKLSIESSDGGFVRMNYPGVTDYAELGMVTYTGNGNKANFWVGTNLSSPSGGPTQSNASNSSWFSSFDSNTDSFSIGRIAPGGNTTATIPFYINSSGSVGIGTTSPSGKLHVQGNGAGTDVDAVRIVKGLTDEGAWLNFQQGVNGWRMGMPGTFGDANPYDLVFYYGASTPTAAAPGTEVFRLKPSGQMSTASGFAGPSGSFVGTSGPQLTMGYDASNSMTVNTSSTGATTFTASGTSAQYNFAGGNVGVNTTAPATEFHVSDTTAGGAPASTTATPNGSFTIGANGTNIVSTMGVEANTTPQYFWIQPRSLIAATFFNTVLNPNGGNVGIGVLAPDSPLHVKGGAAMSAGWNKTSTLEATYPVQVFNSNNTRWGAIGYDHSAGMRLWVNSTSADFPTSSAALSLLNNGNLGVGTTTPDQKLTVFQNSGSVAFTGTAGQQRVLIGNQDSVGTNNPAIIASENGNIRFGTGTSWAGNGGTFEESMIVTDGGTVGVGTSSPLMKFDVRASGSVARFGKGSSPLTDSNAWYTGNDNGSYIEQVGNIAASVDSRLRIQSSKYGNAVDYAQFFVDPFNGFSFMATNGGNGSVGIGVSSPGARLETLVETVQNTGGPVEVARFSAKQTDGSVATRSLSVYSTAYNNNGNNMVGFGKNTSSDYGFLSSTGNRLFTIQDGGNVGIGVISPTAKLEVAVPTDGSDTLLSLRSDDGGWATNQEARIDFKQSTTATGRLAHTYFSPDWGFNFYGYNSTLNSSPVMTIRGSGNVGIGTSSPGQALTVKAGLLHVASGATLTTTPSNTSGFGLFLGTDSSAGESRIQTYSSGGDTFLTFHTNAGGAASSEKMRIDKNGNVGIGTSSPSYKLDVAGSLNATQLLVNGTDISSSAGAWTIASGNASRSSGNVGIGTSSPANQLQIGSVGSSGYGGNALAIGDGTRVMAIDHSAGVSTFYTNTNFSFIKSGAGSVGNVGIGTTSPGAILTIHKNVTTNIYDDGLQVHRPDSFGQYGFMSYGNLSQDTYFGSVYTGNPGSYGRFTFRQYTQGMGFRDAMHINNDGNVGIGTTAPGEKLDVSGNVRATSFISTSDRNLKKNIHKVQGREIVEQLGGYSYAWKADGRKDYGVIAQEVEKVMPHAVATHEKTGEKAVRYNALFAPIIESLKELFSQSKEQAELVKKHDRAIASLKDKEKKISELEQKNKELEARLERLEKLVDKPAKKK